jgi:ABC-type nitrate/sulfonate/bicarbonate transport system ATPase subunit
VAVRYGLARPNDAASHFSLQVQKIGLLRVVLFKYGVIVLDEPSTALDAQCQEFLWQWLRKLRRERNRPGAYRPTILLVTHDQQQLQDIVRLCRRCPRILSVVCD